MVTGGCPVSVNDLELETGSLNLAPNPANGRCAVTFTLGVPQSVSVSITGVDGRTQQIINSEWYTVGSFTKELAIAQQGLYIVKVVTGNKVYTARLVNY